MAKVLDREEYAKGRCAIDPLYPVTVDEENMVEVEKVVDVTDDCPKAKGKGPVIFIYIRGNDGSLVQIRRPHDDWEMNLFASILFDLNDLDGTKAEPGTRDVTFATWASSLGLDKQSLRELIERHAPQGKQMLAVEEMQEAVRRFELYGAKAYQSVVTDYGEQVARLLLVVQLRRSHGSMQENPDQEQIKNSVTDHLRYMGIE